MKREDDWRIFPPQFADILLRVGRDGETLEVDCGNKGRALNFSTRLRGYCKVMRNAKEEDVGELRLYAPLVSVRIKPGEPNFVQAQPQAESANAVIAEKMLAGLPAPKQGGT